MLKCFKYKTWKVYTLTFDNKPFSIEDIADTITCGLSSIPDLISAFNKVPYLVVKDNYKLFVTISKTSINIKALSSNTNFKKLCKSC